MDRDENKWKESIQAFETLYGEIKEIAEISASVDCDPLRDPQFPVHAADGPADAWRKYIRAYAFEGISPEAVAAIQKSMLPELGEDDLTGEEKRLCERSYDAYLEAMQKEAAQRLGGGRFDVDLICRARRLCRLMLLHAPEVILRNEAQRLMEVFALNRLCQRELRE